jgi:hypothetical protein
MCDGHCQENAAAWPVMNCSRERADHVVVGDERRAGERTARLAKRFDGLSADDLAVLEAALPVLDRIFGGPLSH